MAKKNNYYVVKHGREVGMFYDWLECSEHVTGFPGAIYKGFQSLSAAEEYAKGPELIYSQLFETEEEVMATIGDNELIAYVDGSSLGDGSKFSWAAVLFSKKFGKQTISGSSDDKKLIKYRNIAGELHSAVESIEALDEWETNNPLTADYLKFSEKAQKAINCNFVKVIAHTNDVFNEEADILAKRELGI